MKGLKYNRTTYVITKLVADTGHSLNWKMTEYPGEKNKNIQENIREFLYLETW